MRLAVWECMYKHKIFLLRDVYIFIFFAFFLYELNLHLDGKLFYPGDQTFRLVYTLLVVENDRVTVATFSDLAISYVDFSLFF